MGKNAERTARQTLGDTAAAVWFTPTDAVDGHDLVAAYEKLLDGTERRRYESFRFPADRHLYLVAHALLRTSLSRYADVSPRDWQFNGEHGQRPEIVNNDLAEPPLRFSLSHTRGLAACIITRQADVGVDVEPIDNKVNAMTIGERFFSSYESQQLAGLSGDARRERFLQYWTLKEAYVKACGVGLSIPLDDFYFHRDDSAAWRIKFTSAPDSAAEAWQFWSGRPTAGHIMSIAIRRRDERPFDISIQESLPLGGPLDSHSRLHNDN